MKKVIKRLRNWVDSIAQDVKDHLFAIVVYFFAVVQWALVIAGKTGAYYAIIVGLLGAISWEVLNAKYSDQKFSIWESGKDLAVYIVFAILYIVALEN